MNALHSDASFDLPSLPPSPEGLLLQLLNDLDTTEDPHQILQLTLDAVVTLVPCCQAFAYEWEDIDGVARLRASASTDAHFLNDYFARFRAIDPLTSEAMRSEAIQSGRGVLSRELISPEELRRHPFHTRFLARHGDLVYGLGHFARINPQHLVGLRLFRAADKEPFSACERDALSRFLAHVAHRLRARHQIQQMRNELAALRAGINAWNRPILILDADGVVLSRNTAADAVLQEGQRLRLDSEHRLVGGDSFDHALPLRAAMADIIGTVARRRARRSRCVALPTDDRRIARHYGVLVGLDEKSPPTRILLTLIDHQQPVARHDPEELRGLFGFTATEARIANALVGGLSTEEISQTFLVRPDTVRTHIKRLLAKTGTRSHAELQKLLIRLTPNLVAFAPGEAP